MYELAVVEKAEGTDYEGRLRSLKEKKPDVDPAYFDSLITLQKTTSSKVHEGSYDGWNATHIRFMLSALFEVLNELYVIPDERKRRRAAVEKLGQTLLPKKEGKG